ncbi:MAG: DUF4344 domain-containing metallopeptidase, partial [Bordetella sp.]|nr:DUF4344 domain-containing metallopeptidase [Bordetella sp.]
TGATRPWCAVTPNSPPPRRESGGGGGAGNSVAGTGPLPLFGGDSKRTTSVYIGLVRSIFLHEFGHALIGELELPSTGAEEDAVDIYSALRIVEPTMYPSQNADENDMVRDAAVYAALQWFYSGKLAEARGAGESPWQDEHTGDLKRFRNMFCIMYGGNTAAFASLANAVELDERTRSRCTDEFNKQNRAWRKILAPHTRVGTWSPDGQQPANAPGAPVNVVFEPSKSKVGNLFANNFAEPLAQNFSQLGKTYVLPRPVNVTFKDCGTLNAWYDPRAGSVTMCYELLEHLAVMISDIEMGTVGGMPKGDAAAQPARQQGAPGQGAGQGAAPPRAIDELQDMGIPATALLFSSPYKGPTPNKHFNAQIIRTEDFLVLAKNHRDMLLIDTSGQMETIPSAISLADAGSDGSVTDSLQSALDAWLTKTAGEGRKAPLVFFGAGLNDRSSYNAALRAATLGWPTYWYRGGMQAWKANGGTTVPLKSRKDAPQQ